MSARTLVRVPGVPLWITVLALLLGLFATVIGLVALVNPHNALGYVAGADDLGTTWAGRNAGLGVVLLVAVAIRDARAYVVAFSGQVLREVSDLVVALPSVGGAVGVLVFLAVDLVGLVAALRALRDA